MPRKTFLVNCGPSWEPKKLLLKVLLRNLGSAFWLPTGGSDVEVLGCLRDSHKGFLGFSANWPRGPLPELVKKMLGSGLSGSWGLSAGLRGVRF